MTRIFLPTSLVVALLSGCSEHSKNADPRPADNVKPDTRLTRIGEDSPPGKAAPSSSPVQARTKGEFGK